MFLGVSCRSSSFSCTRIPILTGHWLRERADMAKSQKRSTREIRKPKAAKSKPPVAVAGASKFPVDTLMQKSKDKL
jgi:hypothetical protein